MTSYTELGNWLESKGIGHYFQNPELMVVSNKNPAMPDSGCFWVTRKDAGWYIGTWLPAVYRVPSGDDIGEVCETVFKSSKTALWTFSNDLATRFNLIRLTDTQMEELGFA